MTKLTGHMNSLSKLLEEAHAMQRRRGLGIREALAMVIAGRRRNGDDTDMPAATSLYALLPRDREPTIEEIRAAWQACLAVSVDAGAFSGEER